MHGRITVLDASVAASAEQAPVGVEEGGTDRDASLGHTAAGLGQGDTEHLAYERPVERVSGGHMLGRKIHVHGRRSYLHDHGGEPGVWSSRSSPFPTS